VRGTLEHPGEKGSFVEIKVGASELEALRAALKGVAYAPGEEGYDEARAAWNLNAEQRPAVAVVAEGASDVIGAVRFARERSLGVGVMATGHGVASPCDGGVLVNTSRMKAVRVDPEARTARVEPGALWRDVIPEAQPHGLVGLQGSSSGVGVVGYTMGGGFGWLGREYGFNAESVREADVVTADGELVKVSAYDHPDLFWGLKGGGGNFGVVTSLEFALYSLESVYGGNLMYPIERAAEVLELYARWSGGLPDEMTTAFVFLNFPPLPFLPEPLRGASLVTLRLCYCGEDSQRGEELLAPWRELGEPYMDTVGVMSPEAMDSISMDPVDPIGAYTHSEMLRELSPETVETLLELAGPESESPLLMLEIRQLGGALTRPPSDLSPMGRSDARFLMNGVGATPTPEAAGAVQAYLAYLAESVNPYRTGTSYVNFLDLDGATPERVRASYSPEDWQRLVSLKDRYDPNNLFRFNRNIPPSGAWIVSAR
jgi:FAD/FMN-containing dehydrogenase